MCLTPSGGPVCLLQATYAKQSSELDGVLPELAAQRSKYENALVGTGLCFRRPLKTYFLNQILTMGSGMLLNAHFCAKIKTVLVWFFLHKKQSLFVSVRTLVSYPLKLVNVLTGHFQSNDQTKGLEEYHLTAMSLV